MNQHETARTPFLLSLEEELATNAALVGPKAARLAILCRAGYNVPPAIVLTVAAYHHGMDAALRAALARALHQLQARGAAQVAVRSSAVAEDSEHASYGGMQESVLGVSTADALYDAVERVWASYRAAHVAEYRQRVNGADVGIAVILQWQIAAEVAGVLFARNPMTGADELVVEAIAGLGDALMSGQAEPHGWRIIGERIEEDTSTGQEPLLSPAQLRELEDITRSLGALFGAPQDVEWGYASGTLWIFQSRPITTLRDDWFTNSAANDHHLWGAAFLNERFILPVSPLGWTMVALPLERLAFRGPLELLGVAVGSPLLKLWKGHPYSRVEAWQKIYKLFPDWLLPDDALRFFPNGDSSLRHAPREPVYGAHLLRNALRVLWQNPDAAAPWRNPTGWAHYERKQTAALLRLDYEARRLNETTEPTAPARAILAQSAALTDELLEYHRWSLLYADVFFSLLRRLLNARYGIEEGARRLSQLTTTVESPTTQMNRALNRLVEQVPTERNALQAVAQGEALPVVGTFWQEVARFLAAYGHRFMSLDIYDPPWEADPSTFARLLLTLTPTELPPSRPEPSRGLLGLTRQYLRLREAQRFYWQKIMALQRRVIVTLGSYYAQQGQLRHPDDIFGVTWSELLAGAPRADAAAERIARLRELRGEAALNPAWHYPDFLRGNTPLLPNTQESTLRGRPVSPGVARGPARLVHSAADFGRVNPGDVLITQAPDPGWTPLFGTVVGMVTERGGQLSHGAVIAREYKLPTVSGIPGLLASIKDGEWLLVDGTKGVVMREP